MPSTTPKSLYTIPISARPFSFSIHQCLSGLGYTVLFNLGCLMIHGTQLLVLVPLRAVIYIIPWPRLQYIHESGVRWTKTCFIQLLVLMVQWFAPTRIVLTFEGDNLKEEDVLVRNPNGHVVRLNLPQKLVLIANHQIYADWIYLWFLAYLIGNASDVLIVLKDSLKWIPIVGWAMQCFHFIFLARSWASDRLQLSQKLARLAARAQLQSNPLALMIFPEGTLVSEQTRPISKKYADKNGIDDMRHMLLPRSTGLLHCLRSLSPEMPDLHLLDVTVAYEGIPPLAYGQSYYTLRSIFLNGVPPPRVHMHLRLYKVAKDIPIGNPTSNASSPVALAPKSSLASSTTMSTTPSSRNGSFDPTGKFQSACGHSNSSADRVKNIDPSPEETATFEVWLRERWREKDDLIEHYLNTGTFARQDSVEKSSIPNGNGIKHSHSYASVSTVATTIPVKLHSAWEIPQAFAGFAPVIVPKVVRKVWDHFF